MENLITLEMIEQNEDAIKGRLFTGIQLAIIKKRLKNQKLDSNERTYYYKFIKPKLRAILSFANVSELNIQGRDYIITNRITAAVNIIKRLMKKHKNQRIIISGSFLFNKDYNDIDVFVFSKYNKDDYRAGKIHVNFLKPDCLDSLFFSSLCQISICNFRHSAKKEFDIELDTFLHDYELLVNSILNKDEFNKELRNFLLKAECLAHGVILNPKQLYELRQKVSRKIIEKISNIFINALILSPKRKMMQKLKQNIRDYQNLLKRYKTAKNLKIYIETYKGATEFAA
jgi:hypothetical protein